MCTSGGFSDIIGKNRNVTRGVKVEVGTEVSIDLYTIIEYGSPSEGRQRSAGKYAQIHRSHDQPQGGAGRCTRARRKLEKEKRECRPTWEHERQSLLKVPRIKARGQRREKRGKDAPAPVEEAPAEAPVATVAAEEAPAEAPAETPEQLDPSAEEKAPAQDEPAAEATVQPAADVPSEEPAPAPVEEKPKTTRKTTRRTRKE